MAGDNVSSAKKRQTLSSSNRYDYAVVAKLSLAFVVEQTRDTATHPLSVTQPSAYHAHSRLIPTVSRVYDSLSFPTRLSSPISQRTSTASFADNINLIPLVRASGNIRTLQWHGPVRRWYLRSAALRLLV